MVPDAIVVASWRDMVSACDKSIPGYLECYTKFLTAVKRIGGDINEQHIKAVAGDLHNMCKGRLRHLNFKGDCYDRILATVFVNMCYGRFRTPDMYRVSSSTGASALKRHWFFAARRQRLTAGDGDTSKLVCSEIYKRMSRRVIAHRTKRDILCGIGAAVRESMASVTGKADVDEVAVSGEDASFTVQIRKNIWQENLRVRIVCHRAGINLDYQEVVEVISNVYEGLCCLIESASLKKSSAQLVKVGQMIVMEDSPKFPTDMLAEFECFGHRHHRFEMVAAKLFYAGRVEEALSTIKAKDSELHPDLSTDDLEHDEVSDALTELREIDDVTNMDEA